MKEHNIEKIKNIVVPGCFDMISIINKVYKDYDLIICCGSLLKGITDHYEYTSLGVMQGLIDLQIKWGISIVNGIFNCTSEEQIISKCKSESGSAISLAKCTVQILNLQ